MNKFPQGHNQRWIMGLWLWSENNGPVIPMEVAWLSTPKEVTAKSQQYQDHVNCVFWWGSVVHHEYAALGQTVSKKHYFNVLCWLRNAISQKQPQLRATGNWQLHHDNIPAHASSLVLFLCEISDHPDDSVPLQPRLGALWLLAFPKTKITFEREKISDHQWDSRK